jgi:hypothetical protein
MKKLMSKNERSREKQESSTPVPAKMSLASTRWLIWLALLVVAGVGTFFVVTAYVLPKLPDSIVGTWRMEEGGETLTFRRDGTFTFMVKVKGSEVPVEARVELADKTLRYIIPNFPSRTQTILKLTDKEMIVEENGVSAKLIRVE